MHLDTGLVFERLWFKQEMSLVWDAGDRSIWVIRTNRITHCIGILRDHWGRLELAPKDLHCLHCEIEGFVLGSTSLHRVGCLWICLKALKSQFGAKMSRIGRRGSWEKSVCCEVRGNDHCRGFARYQEPNLLAYRVNFWTFGRLLTLILVLIRIMTWWLKDAAFRKCDISLDQIN